MTMILFGKSGCQSCEEARNMLGRTPIDWFYSEDFSGDVPCLQTEDRLIFGLGAIQEFIHSEGFR